jgi:hypothetical protein
MNGRDPDDIRSDMQALSGIVSSEIGCDVSLMDTIWNEDDIPTDIPNPSVWCLGRSIESLGEADLVVFDPEWRTARGCILEHMVCALYNIPYVDMSMDYSSNEDSVVDYTHDWDLVGEIGAAASEAINDIENDISENDEDALGFEHDDVTDIEGKPEVIENVEDDPDALEPGEYDADK